MALAQRHGDRRDARRLVRPRRAVPALGEDAPAYWAAAVRLDALRRIGQLQPTLLGPATALAATAAGGVIVLVAAVAIATISPVGEDPAIK